MGRLYQKRAKESDLISNDNRGGDGHRGAGRGGRGGARGRRTGGKSIGMPSSGAIDSGHSRSAAGDSDKHRAREVVIGVRRIWGTVKSSSHLSVKNAIVQLAGIENIESIHVKRKYKSASAGKPRWWYIIHAEEEAILKPLEEKWENIKLQTGWRLERCSRPVERLTESLPLHSNHNNVGNSEVYSGTAIPCSNNATPVPSVLSPAVAYTTTVSAALSPAVASHDDPATVAILHWYLQMFFLRQAKMLHLF